MEPSRGVRGRLGNAILIAGPTASGKSARALDLAVRTGGVVVNADSMQVYSVLEVLTARPGTAELGRAPHELYGHVPPRIAYSTGEWLRDVARLIEDGRFGRRPAIFVGGTGLYFRGLSEGLSAMPEVPASTRDRWRYKLLEEGHQPLFRILQAEDPRVAARLRPTDGQRIARALEVLESSGRSILDWQAERVPPLIDAATARFEVLEPDRGLLVSRIDERFDAMLGRGALAEVQAILNLQLDPALPASKAIGVRELAGALAGEWSMDQAIERAKIATRQYAKRQSTWFRNQFGPEWTRIPVG